MTLGDCRVLWTGWLIGAEWQMLLNVQKCKLMHIGKCRVSGDYCMDGLNQVATCLGREESWRGYSGYTLAFTAVYTGIRKGEQDDGPYLKNG